MRELLHMVGCAFLALLISVGPLALTFALGQTLKIVPLNVPPLSQSLAPPGPDPIPLPEPDIDPMIPTDRGGPAHARLPRP